MANKTAPKLLVVEDDEGLQRQLKWSYEDYEVLCAGDRRAAIELLRAHEPAVVHVNRLHILKRFQQYLRTTPDLEKLDETALRDNCRALLTRAYEDFVRSTPAQEKVFKVFQDMDGGHVAIDSLRLTLPSRREGA